MRDKEWRLLPAPCREYRGSFGSNRNTSRTFVVVRRGDIPLAGAFRVPPLRARRRRAPEARGKADLTALCTAPEWLAALRRGISFLQSGGSLSMLPRHRAHR